MATFGVRASGKDVPFDEKKADPQKPLVGSQGFRMIKLRRSAVS